jgi:hypothetical protein
MCPAVPRTSGLTPARRAPRRRRSRSRRRRASARRAAAGVLDAADEGRVTGAQPGGQGVGRAAGQRHGRAGQLEQRQGPAADLRTGLDELAADQLGQALRARARVLGEHPQDGDLGERARRIAVQRERGLERGERELVDAHRACERVAPAGGDRLVRADHQAGLRPAEELVAAEADDGGAGADRPAHGRLVGEDLELGEVARSDVVDDRQPEPAEGLDLDLLGEPEHAEVRRVRAQDHVAPGLRVVAQPRAVRRADLDEPRAGLLDDLGHPERAADLHELAARDDHLAPERSDGEQGRRRAVVDRQRRLGAGHLAQELLDVGLARAAPAAVEVELEVPVALGGAGDRVTRGRSERRPPEVRVDDHAGRVEHTAQRRAQALARPRGEIDLVVGAGEQLGPALGDDRPRGGDRPDLGAEEVDRRQGPQASGGVGRA